MSFTPSSSAPGSGSSTPVLASIALQKEKRPALAGAKTRQRKGVAKAAAKFEPTVFRDDLLRSLSSNANRADYEAYLRILEAACNELDFRKYENQLFELLIVGRLLVPGGNTLNDGAEQSPFCVVGKDKSEMKEVVGVFGKLIRRYKYLQKPLEESSLPSILQYANKLDKPASATSLGPPPVNVDGQNSTGNLSGTSTPTGSSSGPLGTQPLIPRPKLERLATFVALAIASGLAVPPVLASLKREHLVKDSTALVFLLAYLKTYLSSPNSGGAGETMDHLSSTLRRGGCTDLLDFFPLQKRSVAELHKEFKAKGLDKVAEWYAKIVEGLRKDQVLQRIRELASDSEEDDRASNEEIVTYLNDIQKSTSPISEPELIAIIWAGLMANLDLTVHKDNIADVSLKWIKSFDAVFEKFTNSAKTEIMLINVIQVYAYDNVSLMPIFPRMVQLLYNDDVLSSQAIFYWFEKGAKPNGKQSFLKAMEPLIKAIKASEDEDEEEEDEE